MPEAEGDCQASASRMARAASAEVFWPESIGLGAGAHADGLGLALCFGRGFCELGGACGTAWAIGGSDRGIPNNYRCRELQAPEGVRSVSMLFL